MSNALTTLNDGQSMLEAMGMANLASGSNSTFVPRISMIREPIMGTMDVGGKTIKTEVVPAGAYRINADKDTTIYSSNISLRIFTIRNQFTRYDVETGKTYKTVQSTDLKGDLKDELGGFNLGKPGGYVEDYNSLSEKQKAVRTAKVYYGVVTLNDPKDEKGDAVEGYSDAIPFVMDVTSVFTRRALDNALKSVIRKNVLPVNYALDVTHGVTLNKAGMEVLHAKVTGGQQVDPDERDQETFQMFVDKIESNNKYILSKWEENNQEGISDEDADVVASFVNVEEAD